MTEAITITAKVAQIVSPREVAFNVGIDDGVNKGDSVTLYRTVEITDPDSGEFLGSVRVPRLNLRISLVNEKFCVGSVTDTVSDNIYGVLTFGQNNTKKVSASPVSLDGDSNTTVVVTIGEEAVIRHIEKNQ
jgi:hypothetical protein